MILPLLVLAALPGTDLAGDVGIWLAMIGSLIGTAAGLIAIGGKVITAPVMEEQQRMHAELDKRITVIESQVGLILDRQREIAQHLGTI